MLNSKAGHKGWIKMLSDEQELEVVRLYIETDETLDDIANKFNVSVPTIKRAVERHGYNGSRCPQTPEEEREAIISRVVDDEIMPAQVAHDFGVDTATVYNILRKAGVKKVYIREKTRLLRKYHGTN